MKTYVTSDTHGCHKQLKEVLDKSGFDYESDRLIHLGDYVDRGPNSFLVIEELLKIKNLVALMGNHDEWMKQFVETGYHPSLQHNGVYKTILSYINGQYLTYDECYLLHKMSGYSTNFSPEHMPASHREFFKNLLVYFVDEQNRLFVHAGYDPMEPIQYQSINTLVWDRELVNHLGSFYERGIDKDRYADVNDFKRVFVGHTPTISFKKRTFNDTSNLWKKTDDNFKDAMYMAQLVDIDTGCCFGNKLTLIDITDDDNHIIYTANA